MEQGKTLDRLTARHPARQLTASWGLLWSSTWGHRVSGLCTSSEAQIAHAYHHFTCTRSCFAAWHACGAEALSAPPPRPLRDRDSDLASRPRGAHTGHDSRPSFRGLPSAVVGGGGAAAPPQLHSQLLGCLCEKAYLGPLPCFDFLHLSHLSHLLNLLHFLITCASAHGPIHVITVAHILISLCTAMLRLHDSMTVCMCMCICMYCTHRYVYACGHPLIHTRVCTRTILYTCSVLR